MNKPTMTGRLFSPVRRALSVLAKRVHGRSSSEISLSDPMFWQRARNARVTITLGVQS